MPARGGGSIARPVSRRPATSSSPADVFSYLAFFQGDERKGRTFETWTGTLGHTPAERIIHRIDSGRSLFSAALGFAGPALRDVAGQYGRLGFTTALVRPMSTCIQVVTTTALREEAERIARELVETRLAACVQIVGPITSTYRWQGKIETDEEWQCWAKTRGDLFARVEEAIRRIHPYELPEILAMPIVAGSAAYLAWLEAETASP